MSKHTSMPRLCGALCCLGLAAWGCGLLEEATAFSVDTDWKTLTLDSSALGIVIPSGAVIPAVSCSTSNDICADASSGVTCSSDVYACAIQCGSGGTCEITASVQESVAVDLSQQVKNETSAEALQKVSLQRVVFNTVENTLNFDTPKIEVFVGPQSATKTTDPGVVKFATMLPIPKGTIVNDEVKDIAEQGSSALTGFVKNYRTPFKFLFRASLGFASGSPVPQGRLVIKLKAYFEVEPL